MNRSMKASYTIEASFIMAISLWAIVSCIQYAYQIHDQTIGAMVLQELTEIARHDESGASLEELAAHGNRLAGSPFSLPAYHFHLEQTALTIKGSVKGGGWEMGIQMKKFNPEEFLRMTTLFQRKDSRGEEQQAAEEEMTGAEQ